MEILSFSFGILMWEILTQEKPFKGVYLQTNHQQPILTLRWEGQSLVSSFTESSVCGHGDILLLWLVNQIILLFCLTALH